MAFSVSSFFIFIIFFFSTSSFIHSSYVPSLISLICIPSPSNVYPIETLLDNLTIKTPGSLYTTSNTSFKQGQYTGLVQCRPGLSPKNCTLCAEAARIAILNYCEHSNVVSTWFDGCYLQISSNNVEMINISNHSCSGQGNVQDLARFVPALGTLLLMLRADVNIPTCHGFSHREIEYENFNRGESKVYGLVECVRSLSTQECDCCIAEAVERLLFYCNGKSGGVSVHGMCLVRFDSSEFYHEDARSEGGGVSVRGNSFSVGESENGMRERKIVLVYWSGGVGCFVLVVLMVWLLRRKVLDRGRVGILDFDQTVSKSNTFY